MRVNTSAVVTTGSSGAAVKELQRLLRAQGYNPGPIDGAYGAKTRAALIAFQKAHHLKPDGVAGPLTWKALDEAQQKQRAKQHPKQHKVGTPTLRLGSEGKAVEVAEKLLKKKGFDPGKVDGKFTQATEDAVRKFQKAHRLTQDGVIGPQTWAALRQTHAGHPAHHTHHTHHSHGTHHGGKPGRREPTVQLGSRGAAVKTLQKALDKHGFHIAPDGVFGSGTLAAVKKFQAQHGLTADGVVGSKTWRALGLRGGGSAGGNTRARILNVARSQLGTPEIGNNGGPILKYPHYFGRGSESWCADFVSWVLTHSGVPFNNPWVPGIEQHLKATGQWKGRRNPQPGDMVLFDWNHDGTPDHIGLVEHVYSDGSIGTIEGNTENPSTGREGVYRRRRFMSQIAGFGKPA